MTNSLALTPILDPQLGLFLGMHLGAQAHRFLRSHPTASLERDEAEVQEYGLAEPVDMFGISMQVSFIFVLDELVAISLAMPKDFADVYGPDDLRTLMSRVEAAYETSVQAVDQGVFQVADQSSRTTIDLVEGRVVIEDTE